MHWKDNEKNDTTVQIYKTEFLKVLFVHLQWYEQENRADNLRRVCILH